MDLLKAMRFFTVQLEMYGALSNAYELFLFYRVIKHNQTQKYPISNLSTGLPPTHQTRSTHARGRKRRQYVPHPHSSITTTQKNTLQRIYIYQTNPPSPQPSQDSQAAAPQPKHPPPPPPSRTPKNARNLTTPPPPQPRTSSKNTPD